MVEEGEFEMKKLKEYTFEDYVKGLFALCVLAYVFFEIVLKLK